MDICLVVCSGTSDYAALRAVFLVPLRDKPEQCVAQQWERLKRKFVENSTPECYHQLTPMTQTKLLFKFQNKFDIRIVAILPFAKNLIRIVFCLISDFYPVISSAAHTPCQLPQL